MSSEHFKPGDRVFLEDSNKYGIVTRINSFSQPVEVKSAGNLIKIIDQVVKKISWIIYLWGIIKQAIIGNND